MNFPAPARAADDEAYWSSVRAQYVLSPDFINLEHGYFGIQARPVFEAFQRYQVQLNAETSYFLRERYAPRLNEVMQMLAELCGVQQDELVITRNLIEAMNILLQGYPFRPGDEVLLAGHDYDTVVDTLHMLQQRKQIVAVQLDLPLDPGSDAEIVACYERALSANTRVLLLTHMVHRTGQIMPVAQIAAMARSHGVDVMVDAAHSFAQLSYTMPQLGADFVAVNLHKWLGAPLGTGLLYIRRPRIAEIEPLFGQMRCAAGDIRKFAQVGTVPPAPVLAIADAIRFHHALGVHNKETRLRYLTQYWLSRVRSLPRLEVLTPRDPQRYCAIAAFRVDGIAAGRVVEHLMQRHRIFTVVREIGGRQAVRVTPQVFTSPRELDLLVAAIGELCDSGQTLPAFSQSPGAIT